MAECEKSKRHFVPWFNSAEWFMVFDLIYGKDSDDLSRQKALKILKIWKSRVQLLQSGAEGTLIILEALSLSPTIDDYNKRLIHSISLMRFLNICAANNDRQGTFYNTAKKRKIPQWVISLRHDIAHSQSLPMGDVLCNALKFSLDWLYKNYWLLVSKSLSDYVQNNSSKVEYDELKSDLEPLLTNYLYINVSTFDKWGYNSLEQISNVQIREMIKEELIVLLNARDIQDSTKFSRILHLIWDKIERKLSSKNTKNKLYLVPEMLAESDIFLGNTEELRDILKKPQKFKQFIFLWEKLLTNIHTMGIMSELIEKLLDVVYNEGESNERKKCAALWLSELGKAFKKCLMAENFYKTIHNISAKQMNLNLQKKCEKDPALKNVLTLNLTSNLPTILTDVEVFKKVVMREPNEYSNLFIQDFMDVCEGFKDEDIKDSIIKLNNSITDLPEDGVSDKIYTVEDLIKLKNRVDNVQTNDTEEMMECENIDNEVWKKVTDIDFEKCPIGILPWQTSATNTLLNVN